MDRSKATPGPGERVWYRSPRLQALCGVAIISFSPIGVRLAEVAPVTAAFFRCLYALPVLGLLAWRSSRREGPATHRAWVAGAAGLLLAVDLSLWHWAIDLIGAGLSTVLGNTQVVFVGLLAWLLHRERPHRITLYAVPIVFVGVVLVSGIGSRGAYGEDPVLGSLLGIATGITYALFLIVFRGVGKAAGSPVRPLFHLTVGATLGSLALGPLDPGFSLQPTWPSHGWLVALALVSQVGGWLLLTLALSRLAALEASVLLLIQPVTTLLLAWLIFHETFAPAQLLGAALILGGIGYLSLRPSLVTVAEDGPVDGPVNERGD